MAKEEAYASMLGEANASLQRIQSINPASYERGELGKSHNFKDAIPYVTNIVNLFKQMQPSALNELAQRQLQTVRDQANNSYSLIQEIESFDEKQANAIQNRNEIVLKIENHYQSIFSELFNIIAFLSARSIDFSRLEREGRSAIQSLKDMQEKSSAEMGQRLADAQKVLDSIRDAAAESGVTKQAVFFKKEAEYHKDQAYWWGWKLFGSAVLVILASTGLLFVNDVVGISPENMYEAMHLAIAKASILIVLGFMVVVCARNFASHKHNKVLNEHRQNALLTYKAIVEASGDKSVQDLVLTHASACIFLPQESGYLRSSGGSAQTSFAQLVSMLSARVPSTADG